MLFGKRKTRPSSGVLATLPLNLDGYMFTDDWDLGVLANEIRSRPLARKTCAKVTSHYCTGIYY